MSFHEVKNIFVDVRLSFIKKIIEVRKGRKVFVLEFVITIAPNTFGFIIYKSIDSANLFKEPYYNTTEKHHSIDHATWLLIILS